jgi:hypothetical protein
LNVFNNSLKPALRIGRHFRWGILLLAIMSARAEHLCAADPFRVGFPSLATGFAPSWVTAEKGIWKKHGLEVELIYLRGGSRTVSALIGGSVDFIVGSDLGVTTAILQGASLSRVGVTTNTTGYSLVTRPGIRTVRDLKGKIVGITPGRDAAYARVVKGPSRRDVERRHSRDYVYAAVRHDLRESRHEHFDESRRGERRRRFEHHGCDRSKEQAAGVEVSPRLHRRHSHHEIA